jgi:hypothetical protein
VKRAGVVVGVAVGLLTTMPGVASRADTATGPALTEPPAALEASLQCSPGVAGATRTPVLLVHGTSSAPSEFAWNWVPAFTAAQIPFCTVELLDSALGDIQASAEYIVHAIRSMHAASGRRIAIVGHSQGGMAPRWALKFWPDTRAMVDDLIGIAASNHGTVVADGACAAPCPPSNWQQRSGAAFLTALNEGAETWAGISYTSIYTHTDEIVFPNLDDTGSTSLHTGDGAIANIAIQDVCPLALTEHIGLGTYDPVAYAIGLGALTHDGPADPARVDPAVCTELVMPGVNPATFATDYAATIADLAVRLSTAARVGAEPALRCYVTDSCPAAAASVPAPAAAASAPAPDQARVRASTLAATGVDLDGHMVTAMLLFAVVVVVRRAVRSA